MASSPIRDKKTLNICTWNANGISNKTQELYNFIQEQEIDIMLIQETKLNPTTKLNFLNYKTYRTDRLTHRGGGTAILIKDNIQHTENKNITSPTGMEVTSIFVTVNTIGRLQITSAYNPPQNQIDTNSFLNIFHATHPSLVGGDLNAKHRHWYSRNENDNGRLLADLADNTNIFIDAPTEYTHRSNSYPDSKEVLDIFCLRNFTNYYTIKVLYELESDHFPVIMHIHNFPVALVANNPKNYDWIKFHDILAKQNTSPNTHILLTEPAIDQEIHEINATINNALQQSSLKTKGKKNAFTLPQYIKQHITDRNKLRRKWQDSKNSQDKKNYINVKKKVAKEIRAFRNENWHNLITSLNAQDKSLWNMIKRLKKTNRNIPALNVQNYWVTDDTSKANIFANNFEKQFQPNSDTITPRQKQIHFKTRNYIKYEKQNSTPINDSPTFTLTELTRIIHDLKINKAPGHDQITNKTIKKIPNNILTQLLRVFNSCVRIGYFPEQWKKAIIKPLLKSGKDSTNPTSYRPISLLPGMSKLLERLIHRHLQMHLQTNNTIQHEQFGFTPHHSTTQQLARIVEYAHRGFSVGAKTVILSLDVEKAFDRLWVNGLLLKCIGIGLPKWMLLSLASFLTGRTFQVQVNTTLSPHKTIRAGVPQGSVLGPTLYNIYISDLRVTHPIKLALYADDTAIYTQAIKTNNAIARLQKQITKTESWFNYWRLKINVDKTQAMVITPKRAQNPTRTLTLFNKTIPWVNDFKYLGVTLDKTLNFRKHIDQKLAQAKAAKIALYPLLHKNSKLAISNKILILTQVLLPILLYACPIWTTVSNYLIQKLETYQNKFIRQATSPPPLVRTHGHPQKGTPNPNSTRKNTTPDPKLLRTHRRPPQSATARNSEIHAHVTQKTQKTTGFPTSKTTVDTSPPQ